MGKANILMPGSDTVGQMANAAAQNARRLLDDADLLVKRGRWPTAYSLAVLAFEEAGKAWVCVIAMLVPDEAKPDFPFGELVGGHLWKLQAAHGMAGLLAYIRGGDGAPTSILQTAEVLDSLAREDNRAKQRGFYADCEDNVIWSPSQVTRDEAKTIVTAVHELLDRGGPLIQPEFIAWLADLPDDVRPLVTALWEQMLGGWETGGYEGVAEALQEEFAKMDGLAQILEEDAKRLALDRARADRQGDVRRQPVRQSRARRRT